MISVFYVSAAAGAGYTCPTYKEYVSCNPGYVLNSTGPGNACVPAPTCDAGYYLTNAGECAECPEGFYCADGVKNECPDPQTHQQTVFPENWHNPTAYNFRMHPEPNSMISQCRVLVYYQTEYGRFFVRSYYNPESREYDILSSSVTWFAPLPGAYLTNRLSSSSIYYNDATKCPAGYYCPDDVSVSVACTETYGRTCGETFGLFQGPAGTYSDAGAAECTVCPAGTWSDEAATTCTTCPDGYSNSDDVASAHAGITSCVAECAAGYYVPSPGEPCTQITGSVPYYTAAHTVIYGDTSGDNYKKCPDPSPDSPGSNTITMPATLSNAHTTIKNCLRQIVSIRYRYDPERPICLSDICIPQPATHGIVQNPCYYLSGDDGDAIYGGEEGYNCVGSGNLISCDAGFWAPVRHTGNAGRTLPCQPVGNGYWSPDGDLARYPCPDGTMTIGYGVGAASANDCVPYKNLHIGDMTLQMSAQKYTTPALHIQLPDGNKYYGYMISGARDGTLNIGLPGGQYGVINPLDQFERGRIPAFESTPAYDIIIVP